MGAAPITQSQIIRAIDAGRKAGVPQVEIMMPGGCLIRYSIAQETHLPKEDHAKNSCDTAFGCDQ